MMKRDAKIRLKATQTTDISVGKKVPANQLKHFSAQNVPIIKVKSTKYRTSWVTSTYTPKQKFSCHRRLIKHNTKMTNSIVLKEEINQDYPVASPIKEFVARKKKKINLTSISRLNTQTQMKSTFIRGSQCYNSTNCSTKKTKEIIKNQEEVMTITSLKHLGNILHNSNYRRTFVIDNDGNNNLNLDPKLSSIRKILSEGIQEVIPDKSTTSIQKDKKDKEKQRKQEKARTNGYKYTFDLLKNNISKVIQTNENLKSFIYKDTGNDFVLEANTNEINKVTFCASNTSSNVNIFNDNNNNKNYNNDNDYERWDSFLDSSLNDELQQVFIKGNNSTFKPQNNKEIDFLFENQSIFSNEDLTRTNTPRNTNELKCENDEEDCHRRNIPYLSPHFFSSKNKA